MSSAKCFASLENCESKTCHRTPHLRFKHCLNFSCVINLCMYVCMYVCFKTLSGEPHYIQLRLLLVLIAAPASCTTPIDLIFMLDASGSIGSSSFEQMKSFVSEFLNRFDVENGTTRVGLLKYSDTVEIAANLSTYRSTAEIQAAISRLTHEEDTTDTGLALLYVQWMMLQSEAGDRPNVPNVVVIFTDGRSDNKLATQVGFLLNCRYRKSTAKTWSRVWAEICLPFPQIAHKLWRYHLLYLSFCYSFLLWQFVMTFSKY